MHFYALTIFHFNQPSSSLLPVLCVPSPYLPSYLFLFFFHAIFRTIVVSSLSIFFKWKNYRFFFFPSFFIYNSTKKNTFYISFSSSSTIIYPFERFIERSMNRSVWLSMYDYLSDGFIIYYLCVFFSITKLTNDLIVRLIIKKKRKKKKLQALIFLIISPIEHARLIIDCWIILWKSCRSSRIIVRAEGECHLEDH